MTIPEPGTSPGDGDSLLYYVSFDRLAELNRSAITLLAARRGPSAPSRLRPDHELKDPQELVEEISEYGAKEPDFIRHDMPIQEIVFRILLSRRNQPTKLRDLHYELTERWATPMRPINVTELGLRRILDNDTYYGFVYVNSEGEEA
jgi:hypothetical protein